MSQKAARQLAHKWAKRRIPAFPLAISQKDDGTLDKRPLTEHGFNDATTVPMGVKRLFDAAPERMRSGEEWGTGLWLGPAGLLALDVDVKKGAAGQENLSALEDEHHPVPQTYRTETPSGGYHLWFRKPDDSHTSNERLCQGVDVRADNGYVVAPGTVTQWGSWKAAPDAPPLGSIPACPGWVWERLGKGAAVRRPGADDPEPASEPYDLDDDPELRGELDRAERLAGEWGDRSKALAGFLKDAAARGLSFGQVAFVLETHTTPYDDVGAKWRQWNAGTRFSEYAKAQDHAGPSGVKIDLSDVSGNGSQSAQEASGAPESNRGTKGTGTPGVILRRLSQFPRVPIEPRFGGRYLIGKMTVIAGEGGKGKSYLTLATAARITTGIPLHGDAESDPPADVVIASFEDEPGSTIRNRADLLEADVERLHIIDGYRDTRGKVEPFSTKHVEDLRHRLKGMPEAKMLIIDPVTAWTGKADIHRDNEVRNALEPIRVLAAERRLIVVLVMHVNKSAGGSPMQRILASVAFGNLPRSGLVCGPVPDDDHGDDSDDDDDVVIEVVDGDRYAVAHEKHNDTGRAPTLGYRIDSAGVFHWEEGRQDLADLDGRTLLDGNSSANGGDSKRETAKGFLQGMLSNGAERLKDEIVAAGKRHGLSRATLERGFNELGGIAEQRQIPGKRGRGPAVWRLP